MDTKEKIFKKALKFYNDQGIEYVGVRELAKELNISPGNLAYHFPKKEDLITRDWQTPYQQPIPNLSPRWRRSLACTTFLKASGRYFITTSSINACSLVLFIW
jgi:AcrR family transcriptional regulator